jgi:3-oxocholest-4-en-26-oate---CoA ligase
VTTYNLSELIEATSDAVPDRLAVVTEARRLTYLELDRRANQLANHFRAAGLGPGDMIGLHLYNGTEYVETMLAAFKIRAIPVNINYRYVESELEQLYRYTDLVALVFHRAFAPVVMPVTDRLPAIRHLLVVDDGADDPVPKRATDYEAALRERSGKREFVGRSGDDLYVTCTGGTTGLPKAVVWRHEDLVFGAFNGGDITGQLGPVSAPEELAGRATQGPPLVQLGLAPLMHVTGHWAVLAFLIGGGTSILAPPGSLDPARAWHLVAEHKANLLGVVGDAMARPLIDEYAAHPVDIPTLWAIGSGGARISPSTKDRINSVLPNVALLDGLGSSETGVVGRNLSVAGQPSVGRFPIDSRTTVLDVQLRPVALGSGIVGMLARRGHVPLGYYKDQAKTKAVFVELDGQRWVLSGDMAILESDGTITLCGRGSSSINTGGEKVFPEEVEQVLIDHPNIVDAIVIGKPDERWGERVVAIVQPATADPLALDDLQQYARGRLAGYKLPRELVVVERVQRMPSGKPDLRWARNVTDASITSRRDGRADATPDEIHTATRPAFPPKPASTAELGS